MSGSRSGVLTMAAQGSDRADALARVEAIYRRHHDQVFRLALRYARGNTAWAEDITQEVFVGLFDVIDRLRDADNLDGWLYRVTTNRCLTRLRRDGRRQASIWRWLRRDSEPTAVDPERIATAREDLRSAFAALERLKPKERIAFYMVHVDGLSQAEVCTTLGHSKGYVSKLVKRAETQIRRAGWTIGGGED